jgi:hypothetical protein
MCILGLRQKIDRPNAAHLTRYRLVALVAANSRRARTAQRKKTLTTERKVNILAPTRQRYVEFTPLEPREIVVCR